MKTIRKLKNLIEKNDFLNQSLAFVCSTSPYRFLLDQKIKLYLKKIKKSKNYNLIIETTSFCNARCLMCPHVKMRRKKELMRDSVFNLIIKRLENEKIKPNCFILNGFGEPLTDGKIIERIKLIKKHFPDSKIKIYTNFSLAGEGKIKKLVASGLDEINISFNGLSKKNYQKVMGLDYHEIRKNISNLIKWRKKLKSKLIIRMSMALVIDNQKDVGKYISFWEKRVDSVSVNRIHTYGGSVSDFSGQLKIDFQRKTFPCKYLWNTIVISVKGEILLCCLDYEAKYKFGNIKKDKILDAFYSSKSEGVRNLHLSGKIGKMEICKSCYTPYRNGVEWWFDQLY